jgi:hypothetical protein
MPYMGYDARCTLRYEGKTSRGTAWLEHKDLVFRGPTRLSIALNTITSAVADGGTLRVRFGSQKAEFEIGSSADKWAARITNPPSRLDKLGVKAGMHIAIVGLDDAAFARELGKRGASVVGGRTKGLDAIFFGANHRDDLRRLEHLAAQMKSDGALWVVRPKGRPEITEMETMAAGKQAGLVDVKVVSFSDTHTAEKFVIPVARRTKRTNARI